MLHNPHVAPMSLDFQVFDIARSSRCKVVVGNMCKHQTPPLDASEMLKCSADM